MIKKEDVLTPEKAKLTIKEQLKLTDEEIDVILNKERETKGFYWIANLGERTIREVLINIQAS